MPRRGTARAEALRRAHAAKAARDVARQHREAQIETALADYYQATALAERVRGAARRRAEDLLTDADRAAAPHDAAATAAVCRLRELLGGITETAQLCGLTGAAVRDLLASPPAGQPEGKGAGHAPAEARPAGDGERRDR